MGVAELLVGILSLVATAIPLCFQAFIYRTRRAKYKALSRAVDDAKEQLQKLEKVSVPWERVLALLALSDELLPFVGGKLWRHFALLMTVAGGTAVALALTYQEGPGLADLLPALLGVTGNLILQLVVFLRENALPQSEAKFLKNVALLHDVFYRIVVSPAVEEFNRRCDETLKGEREILVAELEQIQEQLRKLLPSAAGQPDSPKKGLGLTTLGD